MLTAEEIRGLRSQEKSIRYIAEQEGVGVSAIYARLERDEKPELPRERQQRYRAFHRPYADLSDEAKKSVIRRRKAIQNKTADTASNRHQLWSGQDREELKTRYQRGETAETIALAMHRTYRGVSRSLHRFEILR